MNRPLSGALALILCAVPAPAFAQDREDRARALFDLASAAYEEGQFHTCVAYLERAYVADPRPILLYNLARCYDRAGDTEQATATYLRYRGALEPETTPLTHPAGQGATATTEPATIASATVVVPVAHRLDLSIALPVTGSLSVGLLGLGGLFGGLAFDQYQNLLSCTPCGEGSVADMTTAANTFFVLGGVAVATTITLLILEFTQ